MYDLSSCWLKNYQLSYKHCGVLINIKPFLFYIDLIFSNETMVGFKFENRICHVQNINKYINFFHHDRLLRHVRTRILAKRFLFIVSIHTFSNVDIYLTFYTNVIYHGKKISWEMEIKIFETSFTLCKYYFCQSSCWRNFLKLLTRISYRLELNKNKQTGRNTK